MSASAISTGYTSTSTSTNSTQNGFSLDTEDFLSLLVAELRNQDPYNPTSSSEIVTQVTQLQYAQAMESQTEAMTAMSDTVGTIAEVLYGLAYDNTFQNACALSGSYIAGTNTDGAEIEGLVKGALLEDGVIHIKLADGSTIPYANITSVIAGE